MTVPLTPALSPRGREIWRRLRTAFILTQTKDLGTARYLGYIFANSVAELHLILYKGEGDLERAARCFRRNANGRSWYSSIFRVYFANSVAELHLIP
jgi:hypothetical protein